MVVDPAAVAAVVAALTAAGGLLAFLTSVAFRLGKLEAQVELVMRDVSFAATVSAARVLHREDDRNELDALIDRFMQGQLTRDDVPEFVRRLEVVRDNRHASELERTAARVFLDQLRRRYRDPAVA